MFDCLIDYGVCFFFFKQKTAYEMRICVWSSDVCSSDLPKFDVLLLVCRPYVFTASLPPSVVATAAVSIRKLMHAGEKRAHLWENSRRLHKGLTDLGFKLGTETPQSAIIAVILTDQ